MHVGRFVIREKLRAEIPNTLHYHVYHRDEGNEDCDDHDDFDDCDDHDFYDYDYDHPTHSPL